ncbi:NUDIX domain-containing protein [Tamlana sp. 62-3]|uniref:NUDIX domain-containing protein n=1 Tax=Neotamlana sargassicola TaxID=2883125 RepID=A0A9X1IBM7_9FLAO|nr:NUDIX domain-containing protein [Tamlana sargassicola]MCB4809656.1 NUDIX domain-containing protein [Tamlana sargassicola]
MYKAFVGDKPIVLTTSKEKVPHFKNYKLRTVNIKKVIKKLQSKQDLHGVNLVYKKEEKLLKKFLKKLPNVVAGGGKVYNSNGEVLFIYRNDKWDLPKGKKERKEAIEASAIREVEEETGVKGLEIVKQLDTTYHIFKRNGQFKIKVTYWFEMKTNYTGSLHAQEEEGITKVEWLNADQIKEAIKNSYANIKLLV